MSIKQYDILAWQKQNLLHKIESVYREDINSIAIRDNKQLIYVPKHKGNINVAYSFKNASLFYQHLYNGQVNIIGDILKAYNVSNAGIGYQFKHFKNLDYSFNFKVNNLFNAYYENVALRPMPNRNYNLQLTLNF